MQLIVEQTLNNEWVSERWMMRKQAMNIKQCGMHDSTLHTWIHKAWTRGFIDRSQHCTYKQPWTLRFEIKQQGEHQTNNELLHTKVQNEQWFKITTS
jgi:hypothetical protein